MTESEYLLLGDGPHSRVVAEILRSVGMQLKAFVGTEQIESFTGSPWMNEVQIFEDIKSRESLVVPAIGDNHLRAVVTERFMVNGFTVAAATVAPSANISPTAILEDGVVVMNGVSVNCNARVGFASIINTNASVDHDCLIGDYVHIAPNVALAGGVSVGSHSFIGVGASVIPGITIGARVVIGAGAAVIRDIPDDCVAVGVPAKILRTAQPEKYESAE